MSEQMLAALLGGQGGPPQGPPDAPDSPGGDWLAAAINAVHQGMVAEGDPANVSMLGKILNDLTSLQQTILAPPKGQSG